MSNVIRPVLIGPTGHEADVPIMSAEDDRSTLQRAHVLALAAIRKMALTHGIDLTKIDIDGSGDASDTDTDESPHSMY